MCGRRSGAIWLLSHHPGGCWTLVIVEIEIPLPCKALWVPRKALYKCNKLIINELKQPFIVLLNKIVTYQRNKKNNSHKIDFCKCCDTVMLGHCYFLLTLLISPLTLHLNSLCCCIWYHMVWYMVIIDHQNIGVGITFPVFSCLVQEIGHKIHHLAQGILAMVPFLKMFMVANDTSVPNFML